MRRLVDIALNTFGFARFVVRRWSEDRCPQIAGSLTYTTLLALVPSFAVAVALLSSAPFFDAWMHQVRVFLHLNLAPSIATHLTNDYVDDFAANARRLKWPGIAALLVLSVWMMLIVDRSLNVIWRVRRRRPYWLLVPGYLALLVVGPVLLATSTAATTYLVSLSMGLAPDLLGRRELFRAVSALLSMLAFFVIYKTVPHRHVPWRNAVLGSVVAGVLFEAAKELFAVYVRHASTYSAVYGAFAALPLFLVWIHLSWMVLLLGAELTACAGYWHARLWARADRPGERFHEAVQVARLLAEAGPRGLDFEQLAHRRGGACPRAGRPAAATHRRGDREMRRRGHLPARGRSAAHHGRAALRGGGGAAGRHAPRGVGGDLPRLRARGARDARGPRTAARHAFE